MWWASFQASPSTGWSHSGTDLRRCLALLLMLLCGQALAQPVTAPDDEAPQDGGSAVLDPVTVTAPGLARDIQATPAAVSLVEEEDLQQARQHLQLDESLNRVPGVFFQNRYNFAQNLRLSIRGFGARAPFGVRGIRLQLDGFPETLPDGQSQVDTIDLTSARQVEVLRGPSSALYGNASGGVLSVRTRDGREGDSLEAEAQGGSYGYRRFALQGGGERGPWRGYASAWHMDYDGYRRQSETEKMLFNSQARYAISPQRDLTAVFTAYDQPKGEDPGGLKREEVREDRRQANTFSEKFDAGQTVEQQRLGLTYSDRALWPGELQLKTFFSRRDFRQQLPFPGPSLIRYDRRFYGFSGSYTHSNELLGLPLSYVVGAEVREQRDDRERFIREFNGDLGAQTQDAIETGTSTGVYGQGDLSLTERLTLTLGARFDRLRLDIRDQRGQGEASGEETFNEFSATLGPSYQLHPRHRIYANLGTSFESPTFTEFYDPTEPDQGFDPGLDPQQALNMELGMKGFLGERARYEAALYRIRTEDEIVQVDSNPDRFANAGETRREGVELGLEYFVSRQWTLSSSYTFSNFRYRRFTDQQGNDFSGNRLPGLPEHQLFAELAWRDPASGWYALVDTLLVSHVFAEDGNNERVAGYGLLNTRAGRRFTLAGRTVEAYLAINNLTDKEYFSNVRVNASNDNFFEPAPDRNLFAGVELSF